jgi:hypothetical protein
MSVAFEAASTDTLAAALEALGYTVTSKTAASLTFQDENWNTGSFANGKFRLRQGTDVDAIKREYSVQTVKKAAQKYGWKIQQGGNNKLQLKRRAF